MRPHEPLWPRRRRYLWLALFFSAVVVYASLVPFRFQGLAFGEAVERFRHILGRTATAESRSNFAANILALVPIGYCVLAVFTVGLRSRLRTALYVFPAFLITAALSVAVEFAQIWFPGRYPSLADIVAQCIGAVVGMGLWLAAGRAVSNWLQSYADAQRPKNQIDWLLQAYFVGLIFYSVLPLDLTISPGELFRKYREGKMQLVPFSGLGLDFATFYALLRDVCIFIPVGMLTATWATRPDRPVRPIGLSVLLGAMAAAAIELAQLPVYSRTSATSDLILGTLGVWMGAWIMAARRGRVGELPPEWSPSARHVAWWLTIAAVYSLFLVVIFCAPFEAIDDVPQIKARFDGFFHVPFAGYVCLPFFDAVSEVLRKGLFFAPLGAFFALAVCPLPVPRPIGRILLAASVVPVAVLAVSVEMLQVLLPPHVPSISDAILCTAGAAIGAAITARVLCPRGAQPGKG